MATYSVTHSEDDDWGDVRNRFKTRAEADSRFGEMRATGQLTRMIRWEDNRPTEVERVGPQRSPNPGQEMPTYYSIEVYLPHPIQDSALVASLRTQWSMALGGTTSFTAEGTYLNEKAEPVTIIKVYVPTRFAQDAVMDYFRDRRAELARRFPDQDAFLVTFDPGPVTFL